MEAGDDENERRRERRRRMTTTTNDDDDDDGRRRRRWERTTTRTTTTTEDRTATPAAEGAEGWMGGDGGGGRLPDRRHHRGADCERKNCVGDLCAHDVYSLSRLVELVERLNHNRFGAAEARGRMRRGSRRSRSATSRPRRGPRPLGEPAPSQQPTGGAGGGE